MHLFNSALEAELGSLAERRKREAAEASGLPDTDEEHTHSLRARVAEVRRAERAQVATELLYLAVCNGFRDLHVPLVPPLEPGPGGLVVFDVLDVPALRALYSTDALYSGEALDMVKGHLLSMTGEASGEEGGVLQLAVLAAGQIYMMSAVFGYMLRRAEGRLSMERLLGGIVPIPATLKDYVQSFGPGERQQMTSILSVEARAVLRSHVSALFGDLALLRRKIAVAVGRVSSSREGHARMLALVESGGIESVRMATIDLKRLVLEAVAFGRLLGASERKVDGIYELTPAADPGILLGRASRD